VTEQNQSFEPFADEPAYIHVNEKLVDRLLKRLAGVSEINLLDVAAGTGLMTSLTWERVKARGVTLHATLLDLDLPALNEARKEPRSDRTDYLFASADHLPLVPVRSYNAAIFANSIHLLDQEAKVKSLDEVQRVMAPGGILAINSTFYDGAYPEESKPFYSRWIRRSIVEINRRLPDRNKSEKVQAMDWLQADGYRELVECAGFKIVESRERRVLLSQAAVRAISSYSEFAKGALHATDEDAEQASQALQACVRQTFHDLNMKYLPRNWLEIIAVKP
jgi:ubiquinone/menaquinone biosynthesis C-methylase UbiE